MADTVAREEWEEELLHKTRVNGLVGSSDEVHARLRGLWESARPLTEGQKGVIGYIRTIRECNWRLEQSVWDLLGAIGSGNTTGLLYGHNLSLTDDRWQKLWAYYVNLQNWLPKSFDPGGYAALLKTCDPTGQTQQHILRMLGDRTELKELYVKRLCLWLDWTVLGGMFDLDSSRGVTHTAAVVATEGRIQALDPDGEILPWIQEDGQGHTELCHHKAFRRYDIIISSIGAGKWRAAMPERSTSGRDLVEMHDRFIHAVENWVQGTPPDPGADEEWKIHKLLGHMNAPKRFLAAFLVAILVAQRGNVRAHIQKSAPPAGSTEPLDED